MHHMCQKMIMLDLVDTWHISCYQYQDRIYLLWLFHLLWGKCKSSEGSFVDQCLVDCSLLDMLCNCYWFEMLLYQKIFLYHN